SEPIWMVAWPLFSAFTSPMIAPVLSFTDIPVARPAGAVVAALAPDALADGVVLDWSSALGAADGAAPAGAAEAGAPELVGGGAAVVGELGLAAGGAWANAAVASGRAAANAAQVRTCRIGSPVPWLPPAKVNRRRLANVPAPTNAELALDR